jgi:hypothetical protein
MSQKIILVKNLNISMGKKKILDNIDIEFKR